MLELDKWSKENIRDILFCVVRENIYNQYTDTDISNITNDVPDYEELNDDQKDRIVADKIGKFNDCKLLLIYMNYVNSLIKLYDDACEQMME
jgi:hypothetical protein